jgi:haloalkane dehalogenase
MHVLRTPDEAFSTITDFDYPPAYAEVADGLRMAYVQAGPAGGEPVVLLHGEPTWSYLWRSVIPVLATAGLRVIAPDLVGFGRSDKPAQLLDHTYARQVEWMRALLFDHLNLPAVTMVMHDWGGLIGLRVATENADRVARLVVTNTGLPTGDQKMPEVWIRFRDAVVGAEVLDVGRFVKSGVAGGLSEQAQAAYDAPFPDESFKAGPRVLPTLIPIQPDDPASPANRVAWQRLSTWDKPALVAYSDRDPITGGMAPIMARTIPGAHTTTIAGAAHFLQEDAGPALAEEIVRFIAAT